MTGWRQDVCAGGSTATATAGHGGLTLLDGALSVEHVEVPTDGSRRQSQACGEVARRERAMLGDRLPDPVAGARIETERCGVGPVRTIRRMLIGDKHNSSVT